MKYIYSLLFLFLFAPLSAELDIRINSDAAILINADTGAIIYEKNSREPHYPASITKVATALYALDCCGDQLTKEIEAQRSSVASVTERQRKNSDYTINPHWIEVGGSHIGIKTGERLPFETLLYGMMLASGNDAANVIAQHVGQGSIDRFMDGLNQYLTKIGCQNTNFVCAHGHHHPNHITTAYDMSIITRKAMQNPTFRKIVSTEKYRRPETNKQNPVTLVQTNKLIRKGSQYYYDKAIGIKTGHGSPAQDTLVAAALDNGRTLIAVLMHANERRFIFEDAVRLFDTAFKQPKLAKTIVEPGPQKYTLKLARASGPIQTYSDESYRVEYHKGEELGLEAWLTWDKQLTLPVKKGQLVGELVLKNQNREVIKRVSLYARKDVDQSFSERVKRFFRLRAPVKEYVVAFVAFFVLVFFRTIWISKKR